jgi:putative ABC transport system ATP-binding protein
MTNHAIALDQVRFRYPGQSLDTLRIDRWRIDAGARVFVRGASGSGKSTLLHLLAGLRLPASGEVRIAAENLCTMNAAKRDRFRARHIGIIYQQFNLVPYLSVLDNVLLAPVLARQSNAETRIRAQDLLTILRIAPSLFQQAAEHLSIGQQQRVAIARALINRPSLLLADEPTSALDVDNRDAFIAELMALCEQAESTLLFVSHDASLMKHFDSCVELARLNQAEAQV